MASTYNILLLASSEGWTFSIKISDPEGNIISFSPCTAVIFSTYTALTFDNHLKL